MSLLYSNLVAHAVSVVIGFRFPCTLSVWYIGITCDVRTRASVRRPARRLCSNPGYFVNLAGIGFSIVSGRRPA